MFPVVLTSCQDLQPRSPREADERPRAQMHPRRLDCVTLSGFSCKCVTHPLGREPAKHRKVKTERETEFEEMDDGETSVCWRILQRPDRSEEFDAHEEQPLRVSCPNFSFNHLEMTPPVTRQQETVSPFVGRYRRNSGRRYRCLKERFVWINICLVSISNFNSACASYFTLQSSRGQHIER